MGRPLKVSLSYFPLETSFFYNEKIKNLRRKQGAIGIATYLNILCKVYGTNGYYFKIPNGDKESFYIDISEEIASGNDQIRHVTSRVRETVHHLIEQGLLDGSLFDKDIISSVALQEQYVLSAYRARQKVVLDTYSIVDVLEVLRRNGISSEETKVSSEETQVSSEESTQIKIKENKYSSSPSACAGERAQLKKMYGELGGDVVMISDEQFDDLCDRLSLDEIDRYLAVIRDCELSGKHFAKSHYQAILDMVRKDRCVGQDE